MPLDLNPSESADNGIDAFDPLIEALDKVTQHLSDQSDLIKRQNVLLSQLLKLQTESVKQTKISNRQKSQRQKEDATTANFNYIYKSFNDLTRSLNDPFKALSTASKILQAAQMMEVASSVSAAAATAASSESTKTAKKGIDDLAKSFEDAKKPIEEMANATNKATEKIQEAMKIDPRYNPELDIALGIEPKKPSAQPEQTAKQEQQSKLDDAQKEAEKSVKSFTDVFDDLTVAIAKDSDNIQRILGQMYEAFKSGQGDLSGVFENLKAALDPAQLSIFSAAYEKQIQDVSNSYAKHKKAVNDATAALVALQKVKKEEPIEIPTTGALGGSGLGVGGRPPVTPATQTPPAPPAPTQQRGFFTADFPFSKSLKTTFEGLKKGLDPIVNRISKIVPQFVKTGVGKVAGQVGAGAVAGTQPILKSIQALGSLAKMAGLAAGGLGFIGTTVAFAVVENIIAFGAELTYAFDAMKDFTTVTSSFGSTLGKIANGALAPLAEKMSKLAQSVRNMQFSADLSSLALRQQAELAKYSAKITTDVQKTLLEGLKNPLVGLPSIIEQMAKFVEIIDPTTAKLAQDTLRGFSGLVGRVLQPALLVFINGLNEIAGSLEATGGMQELTTIVRDIAKEFMDQIKSIDLKAFMKDLIKNAQDIFKALQNVSSAVSGLAQIVNTLSSVIYGIGNAFVTVIGGLITAIMAVVNFLTTAFLDGLKSIYNWTLGWFTGGFELGDAWKGLAEALGGEVDKAKQQAGAANPMNLAGVPVQAPAIKGLADIGREVAMKSFAAGTAAEKLQEAMANAVIGLIQNPQGAPLVQAIRAPAGFVNPQQGRARQAPADIEFGAAMM